MKDRHSTAFSSMVLAFASLAPLPAFAGWDLDPSHTHVSFQVGHLGVSQTPGLFRKFNVRMNFDDKNIEASSVTITIDAASIDTVSAERDAGLRGADWFDTVKYPSITFASTAVRRVDDKHYVISGNMTIRGTTLPVDFSTVLTNRKTNPFLKVPMVGFYGNAKIKRSDFGLMQYPAVISDEVDLKFAIELLQKP